eukprot:evm.model.scf_2170.1 EVM.evm.TU.scf_2170.1   scf_2170:9497-10024(+)
MAQTILKTTMWFLVVAFALGGLVLSIVGLGNLHDKCKENSAYEADDDICDEEFRSVWWAIIFAFCSGVLVLVSAWWGWLKGIRWLALVLAFVVMSSVDLMDGVEEALVWLDERRGLTGDLDDNLLSFVRDEENSINALVAGLLCMTAANWLIIICTTAMMEVGQLANKDGAAPLA